ncbi:hypothetical protein AA313_de0203753 [Arthrobotrys entomopaga]|nr:hypothetical protein AA313_de0203753 [Arthrobotrys entomopaga]
MSEEGFLTRKFGDGVENYFSGSPLNRLAFLRTNHIYLSTALTHPSTRFLLLNNLDPFTSSPTTLSFATYQDVKPLISNPYSTAPDEKTAIANFDSSVDQPTLIFLGIDEKSTTSSSSDSVVVSSQDGKYTGQAYFCLDVTVRPTLSYAPAAEQLLTSLTSKYPTHEFRKSRLDLKLIPDHAAIWASARTLTNWNVTAPYCAGCGQKTMSVNAGTKRACPPTDKAAAAGGGGVVVERRPCPVREGIHNVNFPRTDPSVIMAVISSDGEKILLGRQKRWPK